MAEEVQPAPGLPVAVLISGAGSNLGALIAATFRPLAQDVYFQVGLLTLVGLSAKNAILIIEFAKDLYDQGEDLLDATVKATRLRLRP